ncbi:MAG: WYL domain-containing protein [Clostridiales bacterium]|nr:WYL domain-containing protein [Clostridiales bacterium]
MGDGSHANRARRLLALIRHLEPGLETRVADLAEQLGVSELGLTADLETLSLCAADPYDPLTAVPLYVEDGVVHVFGQMPALDRAIRLTAAEARALVAALQTAGRTQDDPLVTRVLAAASTIDAGEVERAVRAATAPDNGALTILAAAVANRERVRIEYQGRADDTPARRTIEPLALQSERGAWYAHAFCRHAGAPRTFRIDRIFEATPLGEHFESPHFEPDGQILPAGKLPHATIALAPGIDPPEREWPGMRVVPGDGPGTLVEVPYAGTAWIARQVASYLGDATVIEPFEVREAVAALVARETRRREHDATTSQSAR